MLCHYDGKSCDHKHCDNGDMATWPYVNNPCITDVKPVNNTRLKSYLNS